MADKSISKAELAELSALYADAAAAHTQASLHGDRRRANRSHDLVASVYRELRRRDEQRLLLDLLTSEDSGVVAWAGAHALEFAPADGEAALERIASEGGVVGLTAEMTLETWRKGELHFD
jgi:hypothetical protein